MSQQTDTRWGEPDTVGSPLRGAWDRGMGVRRDERRGGEGRSRVGLQPLRLASKPPTSSTEAPFPKVVPTTSSSSVTSWNQVFELTSLWGTFFIQTIMETNIKIPGLESWVGACHTHMRT